MTYTIQQLHIKSICKDRQKGIKRDAIKIVYNIIITTCKFEKLSYESAAVSVAFPFAMMVLSWSPPPSSSSKVSGGTYTGFSMAIPLGGQVQDTLQ